MFTDSSVTVRQNLLLTNARAIFANYKNCRAQGIVWQRSDISEDWETAPVPEFETCTFTACSFLELPENAVIRFFGVNTLYNCHFGPQQTIVVDDNCEFYNCTNLNITFASSKSYDLKIVGSDVTFPSITSTAVAGNYPLKLQMTGGKLTLPSCIVYGDWSLDLVNVNVVSNAATCAFTSMSMVGCVFSGVDNLYIDRAVGCDLGFSGTSSSNIVIQGSALVGNKIENKTAAGAMLTSKTGVTFNCEMNIANRVNMANRTMTKGSSAKSTEHNYNGAEVL